MIGWIIWGSGGNSVDLGVTEHKHCEICERERPFATVLQYRYAHLYWVFSWITHILHQNISTRFRSRLIPRQDPARAESLASDRFLLKVNSLRSVALTVEVPAQIPVSTQAEGLRLRINRPSG